MDSIRSLIGRLQSSEDLDKLPPRLAALLNTYDNSNADLLPQFRQDMLNFLTSCINVADLMSRSEYDANEVIRHSFSIMSLIPTFIRQAEDSKLAVIQYAIQNRETRARMPSVFASEPEAAIHLQSMAAMVDTAKLEIIPIRVSTVTGAPPRVSPPKFPSQRAIPPQVPPSDPIPKSANVPPPVPPVNPEVAPKE